MNLVPMIPMICPNTNKEACKKRFIAFRKVNKGSLTLIMCVGNHSLNASRMVVIPEVLHQLCEFH